ncbi:DNA polymerase III subunit gamma/tau [Achromobacter ruhlandii]|uniref:DNA polymerase III subunit gamma/tau n=1 Tax=Achromobacter ruhlandii TaxID=72557 RepID=UPI0006C0C263|nr:DNA polymerase III subunit gamma/tau [Achromobacter ruhlandii]CUJ42247.1 DNA polymerase III subunit tau [Achromobacter ruhlandii]CUJ59633.1 DNA polymerase III subunit tau [Achromobacter ruhlandii]CUK18667.1 DNA polymerase III subunit tau [Achromobacter ruhlandii]
MTYLVLARKWRPRSFDTLVGQDHVVRALTHALDTQRLHHAWLFTGTRGVGKTTLSRILAKSLNCETGITSKPCGVCRACTEIDAGRFVDYLELDAASNRGVEEMTQLLEQAVYAPGAGRFKVYMIDEVHMLTGHAFNAMLKTLEEPPPHVKFILATTDPQKIPVTVLSRCLQFNLKQMPADSIVGHLQAVLGEEQVGFEVPALRLIGQAASGSMRDALSLTDQAIAYSAGNLTEDAVRGMLGTIDQRHLVRLLDALSTGDAKGVLAVADELATRGLSYAGALADLAVLLSRVAIEQRVSGVMPAEDPLAADIARLAQTLHPDAVQLFYSVAVHSRGELTLAPDEYAGFIMACLRMLALNGDAGPQTAIEAPATPARQTAEPAVAAAQPPQAAPVAAAPVVERVAPVAQPVTPAPAPVATAPAPSSPASVPQANVAPAAAPAAVAPTAVATPPVAAPVAAPVATPAQPAAASVPPWEDASTAAGSAQAAVDAAAQPSSPMNTAAPSVPATASPGAAPAVADAPATGASASPAPAKSAPLAVTPAAAAVAPAADDDGPPSWVDEEIPFEAEGGFVPDAGFASDGGFTSDPDDDFETLASAPSAAPAPPAAPARREGPAPARKRQSRARLADMTSAAWPELAARLPVTGLAAELARQSEWAGVQGDAIILRVAVKTLAESESRVRLQTVLCEHFGQGIRLDVDVGAVGEATAHAVAQAERAARQQAAEDAVAVDPFVQALVADFGAHVVAGSIRHVDSPSAAA